ncbi:MFS transporter [Actinomadura kijaniata]|uniref:MFS transporter n=1 Tax=Actinomadura kijaniata TaxID=46161 RepID=UPI003F1C4D42
MSVPRPPRGGPVLAALATAQFLVVLSTSIVNVALPSVAAGLDLPPATLSWVVNAYVLAFGALLLVGGRLADLLGRRRTFAAGMTLFAVASLAAGLAPSAALLVAARAAQGAGAALLAPAALGLVLLVFPPGPGRGRALGVWGAVSGAGGAAGVLLGGLLTDLWGWPAVFHVTVPLAAASLAATLALVPADPPAGGSVDWTGAVTATGGLVGLVYAVTAGNAVAGLAGVLLLGAFALRQRRLGRSARDPLVPSRLLRRGPVTANVAMALLGAVWIGLFYYLPLYQQNVLGHGPLEAGLTQLPLAGAITLASAVAPRLPVRASLAGALAALAAGLAWLARAPADGTFPADLLGPSLLAGAGIGIAFVHLTGLSARGVAPADSGLAGGLVNTARQLGGAVGLAALTAVAAGHAGPAGYRAAFLTAAAIAALTSLFTLTTTRSTS